MLRLFPCRSFRWTRVRHCAAKEAEQRIQREISKALGGSTSWIPVSRVSSTLSDETCEALSELGGLAKFCNNLFKEDNRPHFTVKSVDGVLCLRQNKLRVAKEVCRKKVDSICTNKVPALKFFPYRPVNLASCQRVWKLQSTRDAAAKITELMEEMANSLAVHYPTLQNKNILQIGYHGNDILCVSLNVDGLLDEEGDEVSSWNDEDYSPIYDLWRMSRYLRTDEFIPIDVVRQGTADILQTPLLQVALTYPERIALQIGSTAHVIEPNRTYVNGDLFGEKREVIGLKFILSVDEISQNLTAINKLTCLTDEELLLKRQELKELQPMRRQRKRRIIVREEFRRKFPKGNPFLNPDVVALQIYDSMDPGVFYNNGCLREGYLPDGGKSTMHVGVDFFEKHSHLFVVQGVTATSVNVMRREQDMTDASSSTSNSDKSYYSDEDILLALIARLNAKKEDWFEHGRTAEVLATLLPRHMFKFMQSKGRPSILLMGLLKRFPEVFEIHGEASENELVHCDSAKLGEFGAQLIKQVSGVVEKEQKNEEQNSEE